MIRSENARPAGWVFVDVAGRDLGGYVEEVRQRVSDTVGLPPGYSLDWSGQYEYLQRAKARLGVLVPVTLAIIVMLLYLQLRSFREVLIVLGTLPMSLVGGVWLLYLLDFSVSVAVAVGFIALAGMAVEVGVVMLVYLRQALQTALSRGRLTADTLRQAVMDGALLRLRPVLMTVTATLVGLLPIMFGSGTAAEVTRRIAAPMVGGVLSLLPLALLVVPSLYLIAQRGKVTATEAENMPEGAQNRVV